MPPRAVRPLLTVLSGACFVIACSPATSSSPGASGGAGSGAAGLSSAGAAGEPAGGSGPSGGSAGSAASTTGGAGGAGADAGGGAGGPGGAGLGGRVGTAGASGSPAGGGGGGSPAGAGGSAGGPPGPCGHSGELFCEDFENLTELDPSRWLVERIGDGSVTIDDQTPAHSGTKSLRVSQVGYNAFGTLLGAGLFPSDGRFFLRVYLRLSSPMTGGHNSYFIAGLLATPGAPYETRVGVQNEMLIINQPMGDRGFLSNANFYIDGLPGAVLPAEAWSCVEVFFDPPNTTIAVWLDDEPIPDLGRNDWQQETFDVVRFGFQRYAGPDSVIGYDDIALGSERIGCD